MTVCLAIICDDGATAIGASDRMVSWADNQTQRMKIYHLTVRVVMMIAGDVVLHTELLIELRRVLAANQDAPALLTVKNIAETYAQLHGQAKLRRAEAKFLAPLGLNVESFRQEHKLLEDKIAADITREIIHFPMPSCNALFMGTDESAGFLRAHIYTVDDGVSVCHNEAGFASIGVGMYQAMSSLMFAQHKSVMPFDEAVYVAFAAKKRAEVAPGVGRETDLVMVSGEKYLLIREHVVDTLEAIYQEAEAEHTVANQVATGKCHDYLESLRQPSIQQHPEPNIQLSGTPPTVAPPEQPAGADEPGRPTENPGFQPAS